MPNEIVEHKKVFLRDNCDVLFTKADESGLTEYVYVVNYIEKM